MIQNILKAFISGIFLLNKFLSEYIKTNKKALELK